MENHCYLLVFFFMLSIMFSEVIALKFDLSALSNAMWDIIRYYQVNSVFLKKEIEVHIIEENIHRDFKFRILFFIIGTCEISRTKSSKYDYGRVVRVCVAKVASRLFKCNSLIIRNKSPMFLCALFHS